MKISDYYRFKKYLAKHEYFIKLFMQFCYNF
jgi:hypothetical protein